ncbi:MAG TPA: TIM-barrel domain-containing protein, partial [Anaerolineales bacterium]
MARLPFNAPAGFAYAARLSGWKLAGNTLIASAWLSSENDAEVQITCAGEGIWRICFTPGGDPLPSLPILARSVEPQPLSISETPARLLAVCAGYALAIDRDPWRLSLLDRDGKTVCRENPTDVDGLNRPFSLPLGFVKGPDGRVSQVVESFHLSPHEHLCGLGEKFTRLDKTGQRIVSWNLDALGAASERSYKNVPFLLSSLGYGLFLNTGRRCRFDLATTSCETYTLTVDGPYLDLYLFAGASPAEILEKYTSLTGRAPVPPKWSFGLWLSGSGIYRDEAAIRGLAGGVEQHDIPCDVIHIDPWWMRWRKYADFQWDKQAFPDPEKLIADLHDRGLRL